MALHIGNIIAIEILCKSFCPSKEQQEMTRERETDGEKALTGNNITSFRRRVTGHRDAVASAPFAGRIGGNQEFIAIGDDEATEEILKKQPDAVRRRSCSQIATH